VIPIAALPAVLLASFLDDSALLEALDRSAALDDAAAAQAYAELCTRSPDPSLTAVLELARARRLEAAQGPAAALGALRRTRATPALAPALADERLRLARAAGDERAVLAQLAPRLAHAARKDRAARAAELVDLALRASRADTRQGVRTALDSARDAELLQVLDVLEATRGDDRTVAVAAAHAALTSLTRADALQRLEQLLTTAAMWERVRAPLTRGERIAAGQKMIGCGRAERALMLLEGLRDGVDSDLARVQTLVALRRHDQALELVEAALRRSPDVARGPLLLEQARLLSRLGRSREGQAAYREFATRFARDPEADRASFFAAWMAHEAGDNREAAAAFAAYLAERPRGSSVELARWLLALNLARAGDDEACLAALDALQAEVRDVELATAARYLRARTLLRLDRIAEARPLLDALVDGPVAPLDKAPYYRALAHRARAALDADSARVAPGPLCGAAARLPGVAVPTLFSGPPRASRVTAESGRDACVFELRARARAVLPDLAPAPGRDLAATAAVGLCDVAGRVLRHAGLPRDEAPRRRHLEAALAAGDATRALRLSSIHYRSQLQLPFSDDTRWIWRLAYPTPARFVELPATRVRPALVRAVARHESHFAADARSRVGALGLMQLMPDTGARLGDLGGLRVAAPADLLDPALNVDLASAYLDLLWREFDASPPLVLAAYNGGPRNVQAWVERNAELPLDLWVESIPFRETRGYVKKVLSAYTVYAWLDGDEAALAWADPPCLGVVTAGRVEF
jgi:soluble lytic murein transglycosylase